MPRFKRSLGFQGPPLELVPRAKPKPAILNEGFAIPIASSGLSVPGEQPRGRSDGEAVPYRRGDARLAMSAALEPATCRRVLAEGVLAESTKGPVASRLKLWAALAERCDYSDPFDLSPDSIYTVMGALKRGGYRSAQLYLEAAQSQHIASGLPWSPALQQARRAAIRSCGRFLGNPKQAGGLPLVRIPECTSMVPLGQLGQHCWHHGGSFERKKLLRLRGCTYVRGGSHQGSTGRSSSSFLLVHRCALTHLSLSSHEGPAAGYWSWTKRTSLPGEWGWTRHEDWVGQYLSGHCSSIGHPVVSPKRGQDFHGSFSKSDWCSPFSIDECRIMAHPVIRPVGFQRVSALHPGCTKHPDADISLGIFSGAVNSTSSSTIGVIAEADRVHQTSSRPGASRHATWLRSGTWRYCPNHWFRTLGSQHQPRW